MAVPKSQKLYRCRDGSVQAKLMIQSLHKLLHPYVHLSYFNARYSLQYSNSRTMSCRTLQVVHSNCYAPPTIPSFYGAIPFPNNVVGCRDGSAKTTETRCRDRAYKHCTNNSSIFCTGNSLCSEITGKQHCA